jgi:hypothetical protein
LKGKFLNGHNDIGKVKAKEKVQKDILCRKEQVALNKLSLVLKIQMQKNTNITTICKDD